MSNTIGKAGIVLLALTTVSAAALSPMHYITLALAAVTLAWMIARASKRKAVAFAFSLALLGGLVPVAGNAITSDAVAAPCYHGQRRYSSTYVPWAPIRQDKVFSLNGSTVYTVSQARTRIMHVCKLEGDGGARRTGGTYYWVEYHAKSRRVWNQNCVPAGWTSYCNQYGHYWGHTGSWYLKGVTRA